MEHYKTKKGILEAMGKAGDDTRAFDRMLAKGKIGHDDDGWYIIDPAKEEIDTLKFRIELLEGQVELLKKQKAELEEQLSSVSSESESDIPEKVYKYLTQEAHIEIDKQEFFEWIDRMN